MKRPITIISLLLLLAAMIGVEHFSAGNREVPTVTMRAAKIDPAPQRAPREKPERPDPNTPSPSVSKSVLTVPPDSDRVHPAGSGSQNGGFNSVRVNSISGIHYIRGRSILKSADPDKESIARLRQAVRQTCSTLESTAVVLDLDGLSTSQSPFLVYANPRFDLTGPTQAAYLALTDPDARHSQENKQVAAGAGGNARQPLPVGE